MGKRIPVVIRKPRLQENAEDETKPRDQNGNTQEKTTRNSPPAVVSVQVSAGEHQAKPDRDDSSKDSPKDSWRSIVQRYRPSSKTLREALATVVDVSTIATLLWAFFFQEPDDRALVLPNRPRFALQLPSRPPLVAGQPIRIEITLKNIGHSEALSPEPCLYHVVARLPDESFVAPPCSEAERKKLLPLTQHVPITPRSTVMMPFVINLTERELRQIRERKAALYLYGEMFYRDFAMNTHPLSFCFFLTGEDDGGFSGCPKGNVNE